MALASRIQPLRSSGSIAPGLDCVTYLAAMATEDDVFAPGISIESIMEHADQSNIAANDFIEVPMNQDRLNTFVFRQIDRDPSTSKYSTSCTEAMTYTAMRNRLVAASRHAGIADFTSYAVRRMGANALDIASVTEDNRKFTIGHHNGSSTFAKHYMSHRNVVDCQGLLLYGQESRHSIRAHGLRHVVFANLTPQERMTINQDPFVIQCEVKYNETTQLVREAHRAYEEVNDLATYDALVGVSNEANRSYNLLAHGRNEARGRLRDAVSLRLQRQYEQSVLTGDMASAPAAAKKRYIAAYQESNEDDSVGQDDLENARQLKATYVAAAVTANATVDRIASNITTGTTASTTSPLAVRLLESFTNASLDTTKSISDPILDFDFLFTARDKAKTSERSLYRLDIIFKALRNPAGTMEAKTMQLEDALCPSCGQPYRDLVSWRLYHGPDKYLTPSLVNGHLSSCMPQYLRHVYRDSCFDALAGQPCPHRECQRDNINFEDNASDVEDHIKRHEKRIRRDLTKQCPFLDLQGDKCIWKSTFKASTSLTIPPDMPLHCEQIHGIPYIHSQEEVSVCIHHQSCQIGAVQSDEHAREHLRLLQEADSRDDATWTRLTCPYCAVDQTLPVGVRAHVYDTSQKLKNHVVHSHIYSHSGGDPMAPCPYCSKTIHIAHHADHLLLLHGVSLMEGKKEPIGRDLHRLYGGTWKGEQDRRSAWLNYVATLPTFEGEPIVTPLPHNSTLLFQDKVIKLADIDVVMDEVREQVNAVKANIRINGPPLKKKTPLSFYCPYCEKDLEAKKRPRCTQDFAKHVTVAHILLINTSTTRCPNCDEKVDTPNIIAHLEDAHNYNMSGLTNITVGVDYSRMPCGRKPKEAWTAWCEAKAPDMSAIAPCLEEAAQLRRIDKRGKLVETHRQTTAWSLTSGAGLFSQQARRMQCPFCIINGATEEDRNRAYLTSEWGIHFNSVHLFRLRTPQMTCPDSECNLKMDMSSFFKHCEDIHAWPLTGKRNEKVDTTFGNLAPKDVRGVTKPNKYAFIRWLRAGAPADPNGLFPVPDGHPHPIGSAQRRRAFKSKAATSKSSNIDVDSSSREQLALSAPSHCSPRPSNNVGLLPINSAGLSSNSKDTILKLDGSISNRVLNDISCDQANILSLKINNSFNDQYRSAAFRETGSEPASKRLRIDEAFALASNSATSIGTQLIQYGIAPPPPYPG
jgi:glutaredoxin